MDQKAAANPTKAKKMVKAKPPEKGFVIWSKDTFQKLITSKPEALISRFKVDHSLVLSVLSRKDEDACLALQKLIRKSHESDLNKKKHRARAFELFRSLVDRKIITLNPLAVQVDLQADFSLHQSLSLWLIDTLKLLNSDSESYALDVITLCEAICESPDLILRKQTDRARQALYLKLREEGVEFEERQEKLDAVEHPKPLREFIYNSFNERSDRHPWVDGENIRPKSIIREMFENGYGFADYIREYELNRAEGGLLRTINEVFKVLSQTVPDSFKNEDLKEIEVELALILRSVDSSLLEEWDRLKSDFIDLGGKSERELAKQNAESEIQSEREREKLRLSAIRRRLRAEVFRFLRALGMNDTEEAFQILTEWRDLNVKSLSMSVDHHAAELALSDWNIEKLDAFLKELKQMGFSGVRTDLKAKEASLCKWSSGDSKSYQMEQQVLDISSDSDLVAFIKLSL